MNALAVQIWCYREISTTIIGKRQYFRDDIPGKWGTSVFLIRNSNYVSIIRATSTRTEMKLSLVTVPHTVTTLKSAITGDWGVGHLPKSELLLRIGIPQWRYLQGIAALIGQRSQLLLLRRATFLRVYLPAHHASASVLTSRLKPSRRWSAIFIDREKISKAIRGPFAFDHFRRFIIIITVSLIIKKHRRYRVVSSTRLIRMVSQFRILDVFWLMSRPIVLYW